MKMLKKILFALCTILLTFSLIGCKETQESSEPPYDDSKYTPEMYYYNKVKLEDRLKSFNINSLEGMSFVSDGIEKVKLVNGTDGDTADFKLNKKEYYTINAITGLESAPTDTITIRFLGVDTPESTAQIQPWGKRAGNYVTELLSEAKEIVLDALDIYDPSTYDEKSPFKGRMDSNGSRFLGLVWVDGKLLNLGIIEQSYSRYTSMKYVYSENTRKRIAIAAEISGVTETRNMSTEEIMFQAEIRAGKAKARVLGNRLDPNFDYETTPKDLTLKQVLDQFDTLYSRATRVKFTGTIVRYVGSNFYMQDEEGNGIYVYLGVGGSSPQSFMPAGTKISVVGRLSQYGGVPQLSDVLYDEDNFLDLGTGDISAPYEIKKTSIVSTGQYARGDYELEDTRESIHPYLNKLVKMTFICTGTGNYSKNLSYTVYTDVCLAGEEVTNTGSDGTIYTSMNLDVRITGTAVPFIKKDFWKDKQQYTVIGVLSLYDANNSGTGSYQLMLGDGIINPVAGDTNFGSTLIVPKFHDIVLG